MLCYAFLEKPLIRYPPLHPLPDPAVDPDWYGQIWLRYPLDPMLYTTHFPHQFRAQSEFRTIVCDCWFHKEDADHAESPWSPEKVVPAVHSSYARMRDWHDKLPEPLTPARITLPSQLMLQ